MKTIQLRESPIKTIDVIRPVIERPPQGANIGEIRARCRVLDALDALAPDSAALMLEDADYATLARAVNGFQFGMASKDLLAVLDDILEAKGPESK